MATSGSTTKQVGLYHTLEFSWWTNSQSVADNTSHVGWMLRLISNDSGAIYADGAKNWSVTIDGTEYAGTNTVKIAANTSKTLASGSTTISHNDNGTKTFTYSFSQEFSCTCNSATLGTYTGSGAGVLDTLEKSASTLTVYVEDGHNGYPILGREFTLVVNKSDENLTHSIEYKCGTASGVVCEKISDSSIEFTAPVDLARQNPAGVYVGITFTCTTYDSAGSKQIGTATSKTQTFYIPDQVKPGYSFTISDPTGNKNYYGCYVQNVSKLQVDINGTTSYDSPIVSYTITANGETYTGVSGSYITKLLKDSGVQYVSWSVTDKRGRTSGGMTNLSVVKYAAPSILSLERTRCNSNGAVNLNGGYIKVSFSAEATPLRYGNVDTASAQNNVTYTLKYRPASGYYTNVTLDAYTDVFSVTNGEYIFAADINTQYEIQLVVQDRHHSTNRTIGVTSGFTLMHFGNDGTSVSIGKLCEQEKLFDVGLPTRFNEPIYGSVLGLGYMPPIPANEDLNNYNTIGGYAITTDSIAATISNMPMNVSGRLEVSSPTGQTINAAGLAYIHQKFIPRNTSLPTYERENTRGSDSTWTYGKWYASSISEQKVLWTGSSQMESGYIELSSLVSLQPNGIVLEFAPATAATSYNKHLFFIPKFVVTRKRVENQTIYQGYCVTCALHTGGFGVVGTKSLQIYDDAISPVTSEPNASSGTGASGITYNSSFFALKNVYGV